ncbi:hypothetical protein PG987_013621 [Apiospora arundinis]
MTGFLVPDTYVPQAPSNVDMNVASIIWGISLAAGLFTASKARKQSWGVYKRTGRVNSYIIMIWLSWMGSSVIGILSWLYLWGTIETSFWIFFFILIAWIFQVQCIIQIIINRIALLMRDRKIVRRMQWGCAIGLGIINVSVFCIWIPARLQISSTFVHKCIFCLIDVALNVYFVYLVRSRLISNGLTKYNRLFKFNLFMIVVSMSLDVILIGVMSLGQGFIYVQFHPLVYMLKLHIELNMADLIGKIVKSENNGSSYPSSGGKRSGGKSLGGIQGGVGGTRNATHNGTQRGDNNGPDPRGFRMATLITANHDFDGPGPAGAGGKGSLGGIQKTTEVHHVIDEDNESRTSSTTELQKDYAMV